MAGTIPCASQPPGRGQVVSMESGLDGRNNTYSSRYRRCSGAVSMESGLDGRNNLRPGSTSRHPQYVSMESGLDGRNNTIYWT